MSTDKAIFHIPPTNPDSWVIQDQRLAQMAADFTGDQRIIIELCSIVAKLRMDNKELHKKVNTMLNRSDRPTKSKPDGG